jgi:hypothetical protein
MKKQILASLFLLIATATDMAAQDFNAYFRDSTLRIDYTFAGNATQQAISTD